MDLAGHGLMLNLPYSLFSFLFDKARVLQSTGYFNIR